MKRTNSKKLLRLLSPRSVAVVGGEAAAIVAKQCQRIGFTGKLFAVHPSRKTLAGITCVESLDQLGEPPDAVFLGVSPELTVKAVKQLSALGAGGAVCYASGFAEAGSDGEHLQKELVRQAGTMPFVGPNCHGFINYLDGVALWPDHFGGARTTKGPALLMQSGNIGINVTFQQRELSPGYVIAMGNNAQLGVHDYIHAMLDDPRVTAIGLHLEGIGNVAEFTRAAIRALKKRVPLVAIKSGSSELGAQLALSHTRSLANPDDLVSLMFERYGIARCTSLPEFLETLKFVSVGGAFTKDSSPQDASSADVRNVRRTKANIASMSCSGGEASHLADLAGRYEIAFPSFSTKTSQALSKLLGERVHVSNPLDYHTYAWGNFETLRQAFTLVLSDAFDCGVLILDYPPPEDYDVALWQVAEQALCAASCATGTRIVVVSSLAENFPSCARARLYAQGVAPMQGLHECVQAIAHANTIGRAQVRWPELIPIEPLPVRSGEPPQIGLVLDETESKRELAQYGLAVPQSKTCAPEDAVSAADSLGYPLVLKALGQDFAHKTELGAVRLNVTSPSDVARHAEELSAMCERLLIETMVDDAVVELLVGVLADASFGQVLVVGAGGIRVELMRDTVQLLLPATPLQIEVALLSLRIGPLFTGFRGSKAADLAAAVDAIVAIAEYAQVNLHRLIELDVNPLLIRPADRTCSEITTGQDKDGLKGAGAVVVDALIRVSH